MKIRQTDQSKKTVLNARFTEGASQRKVEKNTIPVFVINLERRPDRLKEISENLEQVHLAFSRSAAVDAFSHPENLALHVNWKNAYIYDFFRPLRLGALGCYLSHRAIWQKMVDERIRQAVILEDDVVPTDVYDPALLTADIATMGLDCLRLEELDGHQHVIPISRPRRHAPLGISRYRAVFRPGHGSAATLLTQAGARKFLSVEKYWFDLDHFDMWENVVGLKTAVLEPAMFKQSASPSDITRPKRSSLAPLLEEISHEAAKTGSLSLKAFRLAIRLRAFAPIPWPLRRLIVRRLLRKEIAGDHVAAKAVMDD